MTDQDETPEDPDRAFWEAARSALDERIGTLAEEMNIHDADLALLLLEAAVDSRRLAYVQSVGKPSGSGFRTDLDRLAREFGELVRDAKRTAGESVSQLAALMQPAGEEEAGEAVETPPEAAAAVPVAAPAADEEEWSGPDYDRPGRMR